MRTMLLASTLLLSCCASVQKKAEQTPPLSELKDPKLEPAIAELRRLYEAAQSQYERRAVSLRAIDEGVIKPGQPISSVDIIFGTHVASRLPLVKGGRDFDVVYFGERVGPPPGPDGRAVGPNGQVVAIGYIGWSMQLEYDEEGKILNYYLSNLWKGHSSYEEDGKGRTSTPELRRLYENAQPEQERRAVCLRAIDEGVVQSYEPVSTIDAVFGTNLAANLPTKKEDKRTGIIDFASAIKPAGAEKDGARGPTGWFMAVEYKHDGNIANYYLTNVHK